MLFACGLPGVGIYYSNDIHGIPPVMLQSVSFPASDALLMHAIGKPAPNSALQLMKNAS